jgi:hypothetical protein
MVEKETVVKLVTKFVISVSRSTRKMRDIFITFLQNLNFREISVPLYHKNPPKSFEGEAGCCM